MFNTSEASGPGPSPNTTSITAHQCPHLLILLTLTTADTIGLCSAKRHLSCLPKPDTNSLSGSLSKLLLPTGGTIQCDSPCDV